jgi:hypothetical protein
VIPAVSPGCPALCAGEIGSTIVDYDDIRSRVIGAVGEAGARELLDVLTRSEADRAALIGRLSLRADAEWLAELLLDLEVDEVARLHLVEALRGALS